MKSKNIQLKSVKKSPLLDKIKFEPTFFQVLWRFAFSFPLQGEAGRRGFRGEFRPPSPLKDKKFLFSFAGWVSIFVLIFPFNHRQEI
ncbi:MAG: hypothetical protein ACUVQP_09510 [Bacteroidales bacterium]